MPIHGFRTKHHMVAESKRSVLSASSRRLARLSCICLRDLLAMTARTRGMSSSCSTVARRLWSGSIMQRMMCTRSGLSESMRCAGIWLLRKRCHESPPRGKSKSVASSSMVMPRLNMSAARLMLLLLASTSGARYFGSPSCTSFRSFCPTAHAPQ